MFSIGKIRAIRTTEAKVYEAITAVLLVVMWIVIIRLCLTTSGDIPIRFDMDGTPNKYGDAGSFVILGIIGTLGTLLLVLGAYSPKRFVNMPVRIDTPRKLFLTRRMMRIMGVETVLMFISLAVMTGREKWTGGIALIYVFVIVATILAFSVIIARTR